MSARKTAQVLASSASIKHQEFVERENADVHCKSHFSSDISSSVVPPVRSALKQLQNDTINVSNKAAGKRKLLVPEQQPVKPPRVKLHSESLQLAAVELPTWTVDEPTRPEPLTEAVSADGAVAFVPDVDARDPPNALLLANYVNPIFSYLRELEAKYPIASGFLSNSRVAPTMRAILVDWLVDVHVRFKLVPETLYITVATLDRYLQVDKAINRKDFQLVGVTSMLLACKYEEIYAPDLAQFCYVSDNAYSLRDLIKMEIRILKALDFSLGRPVPLHFLRRFTKVASSVNDKVDILHHTVAKYLMELTLIEYSCCQYLPSAVAAAALCLSFMIFDTKDTPAEVLWDATMAHYSGYTVEDIQPLMEHLASLAMKAETSKYQAVRRKYNCEKFYNIPTIHQLRSARLLSMATKHLMRIQ